jgi:hypothetical protein
MRAWTSSAMAYRVNSASMRPSLAGVNYLDRLTTTILAGGGRA